MKNNVMIGVGIVLSIIGLYGLASNAYYYNYMKNLKAGENPQAPVYNFSFGNFPEKNRPMDIYEASLKKDIQMNNNSIRMQISSIILAIGIFMIYIGIKK